MIFELKILILLSLITQCINVGDDYFIDQDDTSDTLEAVTNNSDARRTLKNRLNQSNSIEQKLFNLSTAEDEMEDVMILSYNIAPRLGLTVAEREKNKFLESDNHTNSVTAKYELASSQPTLSLILNSLEEYDYKYSNDTDENNSLVLRNQVVEEKISNVPNKTETDTPYGKFYNLEPAVNQDLNIIYERNIFNNTWYVPQDFPCWELPILYGQLGSKKKKQNVFLLHGGNLVNVIETSTDTKTDYKPVEPPISRVVNKWCEVEPCYGDHTLCLFPNLIISNICDKDYKVYVPSILDQSAIVNTLNTMRNHIANGVSKRYSHLPTAANMKQITYDYDLEEIAQVWLRQCLPGSAPCSAVDENLVAHLECTKYAKYCCPKNSKRFSECTPRPECYIYPIIGCIHIWFSSAGKHLTERDVQCGRSSVSTFNTVQLLWAKTTKIGCAYGERSNGDIRVVCNFSPGAPFYLETKLYCGIIAHNDIEYMRNNQNVTDLEYLASLGIKWRTLIKFPSRNASPKIEKAAGKNVIRATASNNKTHWGVDSLTKLYKEGWVREQLGHWSNGTRSMTARLVAKYTFVDETQSRCDSEESIYTIGSPGSMCLEKGRTYHGLCYDFRDPTPGYRLIAIVASIALFSLILYDLFSGVVRQTSM